MIFIRKYDTVPSIEFFKIHGIHFGQVVPGV